MFASDDIVVLIGGSLCLIELCRLSAQNGVQFRWVLHATSWFLLTPPSLALFAVFLVLGIVAFLVHYAGISVPIINSSRIFDVLALAYVLLVIGVLVRGL